MTDFLSRLAARITAPESGLRPNAPTRFEWTPGLGGEPGLFEVNLEREVRAPPQRRSAAVAPGPMLEQARPAPPPTAMPVESPSVRAPSADGAASADALAPVPGTLAVAQTGPTGSKSRWEPEAEPPPDRFQASASAQPADPVSPQQPAALQPATSTRNVEHHHHHERVIERVVTTVDGQPVSQDRPAVPQTARSAEEQGARARRSAEPEPTPSPQQIREARQTAPQHPAPPLREPARPGREPHPEPPQPAPVVVRIDRLEVRVAPPRAATPAAASRPTQPVTDLDRYLAGLEGRRS